MAYPIYFQYFRVTYLDSLLIVFLNVAGLRALNVALARSYGEVGVSFREWRYRKPIFFTYILLSETCLVLNLEDMVACVPPS